mgnify:CR=1 FL=1|tara:strand:- start:122 stop:574 length:453 start_codon:yes stop_codon:yes gene_type:complete
MKELVPVAIGIFLCTFFYITIIYPMVEYKGGGSVSECYGECYERYKERQAIAKQKAQELKEYNEANGIVVAKPDPGEKIWNNCLACHGAKGEGGIGPKLSGQSVDYLVDRLLTYKDNGKVGPQSQMMWGQAASLSNKDINDISKYIAEQL